MEQTTIEQKPKRKYKKRKKLNPNNWGGQREGSGRKKQDLATNKVPLSMSVTEQTRDAYKAIKARGLNPVTMIEEQILKMASLLGIE